MFLSPHSSKTFFTIHQQVSLILFRREGYASWDRLGISRETLSLPVPLGYLPPGYPTLPLWYPTLLPATSGGDTLRPASAISWWLLETCLNLFIWGSTILPSLLPLVVKLPHEVTFFAVVKFFDANIAIFTTLYLIRKTGMWTFVTHMRYALKNCTRRVLFLSRFTKKFYQMLLHKVIEREKAYDFFSTNSSTQCVVTVSKFGAGGGLGYPHPLGIYTPKAIPTLPWDQNPWDHSPLGTYTPPHLIWWTWTKASKVVPNVKAVWPPH